ncbi:MAG: aspartate aminotransferase family protein [Thermomicrobiales bacterium]|nr:aspartate aminotransferase family protein [Thermomicrobiales bacterium]
MTALNQIIAADAAQIPLYAKRDIALVRGEGNYLFDTDGKRYLDAMSNYGVASLGHAHPAFTAALVDQLGKLTTAHQSFYNDARSAFLEEIALIAPEGVGRSFLSNSGTEAVEAALKFARIATGRSGIVAAKRGYHGRTLGALSATAEKKYREPFEGILGQAATHVAFNDLEALEAAVSDETAAIVLEPVQGEGGIHVGDAAWLQRAADLAQTYGSILIFDEVQSGFRTGAPFFGVANGVVPDIIVTAKAIANGLPVGVTLVTDAIAEQVPGGAHGSTFGGNPLISRGGAETLRIMREDDLYANATRVGSYVIAKIEELGSSKIRAVRGTGLMFGIELKVKAGGVLKALQEHGVLALMAGTLVIRFLPPMTWTEQQADELVAVLADILGD